MSNDVIPPRATLIDADTERRLEEARVRAAFDVGYPPPRQIPGRIGLISRLTGKIPNVYDVIRAGVQFELLNSLKQDRDFNWDNVLDHPLILKLLGLSVSLGQGKGRKEIIEIAMATPAPQKSRWKWGKDE